MTYQYPDAVLMVFCKAPIAGQVKTRLLTQVTPEQARQVHIELTERTLQWVTRNNLCPVQLWCTPSTDHAFFTALAQAYPVMLQQQQGPDLGERMHNAFCLALDNYSRALLIGCDCPSLTEQALEEALIALNQPQCCVLGPAEDGGYVLIGLNQPHHELFNHMPWGTALVLEHTYTRIEKNNIGCHLLKLQWDVDTPEDLARYRALKRSSNCVINRG
ncbi:TIGR04282 family arsenosugar biosynthesis glycosyltransferase [Methylobacter sp. S3L5C]|uniref:TIGR04282 family arsenosugar biosynthesis glycosyltransferase n=1 Tax=Methylobacter sp. S3L5C TaxID=2839024 RepID=UPI001FABD956|nr:TIGR04282 family arsenosugar biosynthesis glycosyltransferase [Methylobacter sp. S3L5C]UOA09459.1 TIGR04282 family arsenosugar biosynthesis glycosyltransferase [Methylobacter sp. S3L5C]